MPVIGFLGSASPDLYVGRTRAFHQGLSETGYVEGHNVAIGRSGPSAGVRNRLHQQGLDTTTPAGKAMFQMMGVFAEFERSMIQERVRAGLARARSEGKLGRPPIAPN
jgi:hypothetical protein